MKVTWDKFNYKGLYFDSFTVDMPDLDGVSPENRDKEIHDRMIEALDKEILEETLKRG